MNWRPIEEAPKDGSELIVKGGMMESNLNSESEYDFAHVAFEFGRWNIQNSVYYSAWVIYPTHFILIEEDSE